MHNHELSQSRIVSIWNVRGGMWWRQHNAMHWIGREISRYHNHYEMVPIYDGLIKRYRFFEERILW